jgi:hypothetical protein
MSSYLRLLWAVLSLNCPIGTKRALPSIADHFSGNTCAFGVHHSASTQKAHEGLSWNNFKFYMICLEYIILVLLSLVIVAFA